MNLSRRQFLGVAGASVVAWSAMGRAFAGSGIKLGVCDWSIGEMMKPSAFEVAKSIGLQGVQFTVGSACDKLEMTDAGARKPVLDAVAGTGMAICSTAMGFLNSNPLATDARGPAWLEQAIDATKELGSDMILLAFFGDGDLRKGKKLKEKELDAVVGRIKDAAPRAQKAGVTLAIENTLTARDNLMILDRIKSDAVKIYYDVGNSTYSGFDVPAEIREMKDLMCQVHFKDGGNFLGKGKVNMDKVAEALKDINYGKWVVLETGTPTKNREADFKTNADFTKKLLGLA